MIDLVSQSSLHTERLGERLAKRAKPGDVIALWGELGTGKTVLARGIAAGLGIDEDEVSSPSFVILHEHRGRLPFFHLDLYRLAEGGLETTGWEECLDAGGVTVIEWPDRLGAALPADRLDVRIEHLADTKRRIVIEPAGPSATLLFEGLRSELVGA